MEYISLLKNRKNAMEDTAKSEQATPKQRQQLTNSLKLMNYSSWATKGLIIVGAFFSVDWKKKVPFLKRQIPLTVGALALVALSDYIASEMAWKKHQQVVVKYTGFRDGVYISPQKLKKMKNMYEKGVNASKVIPDQDYFDDDQK